MKHLKLVTFYTINDDTLGNVEELYVDNRWSSLKVGVGDGDIWKEWVDFKYRQDGW